MQILIRADASHKIGTGHIMRDLVLAEKFKQDTISFATRPLKGNLDKLIISKGYQLHSLKKQGVDPLAKLCEKLSIELLIIDSYTIDKSFERELKRRVPQVTLMVLDDIYQAHHCDIVLNHNIYAKKSKYKNLVPKHALIQCGAEYTLLRDEFFTLDTTSKKESLLIAIGGSDSLNLSMKILQTLQDSSPFTIDVVTTPANKNLEALKTYTDKYKHITLHIQTQEFAKLAHRAKLAIITPSGIANELYSIGTPFIAIQTATNQKEMSQFLEEHHYTVLKKFSAKQLKKALSETLNA
ncbi:MAG: UDP-2,4-diacetamido-2,4,6-trideoxy-beta-L-altropyranose hydrolase [Campylobacterales bacterium]|nr:UDP-2,4-diacetamido-2,4,6-trideoxy-beta-L-altropyranose hydrolase [Campylobacterales bacterium]